MEILVLGATGMAGHIISLYFKENGYKVTALSREPFSFCDNIIGDATDLYFLKNVVEDKIYDVIINCIGILNNNAENNQYSAVMLNSLLPRAIVEWTKKTKTKFINISTDCVFAGNTGPYTEKSIPDGTTMYDRSKALGEIVDSKNLTFRNSIIGPDMHPNGLGLFNWFMKQNNPITGYSGAIWTGVTTLTLAEAMECAINQNLTGLYHLVNEESISKYDLLELFNKCFRDNSIDIAKSNQLKLDKSLINTRNDFSFVIPTYERMIEEMKNWVMNHKDIYPAFYFR
jgi:dTDP-4-dehydrorhamnose reductase